MSGEEALLISGERRLALRALSERAARGASGFNALGIGENDVVALLLRNDFAFFEASLAASLIGAYVAPINWHFTAEEIAYILRDCGARAIVVHADLVPVLAASAPPAVPVLVVPTPPEIAQAYGVFAADPTLGTLAWDAWVMAHPPLVAGTPRPFASIIYTSGTTGRPKGVQRQKATPEDLARLRYHVERVWGLAPGAPVTALMNGPMYHSAPNAFAMAALREGASIVLEPRFEPEDMLRLIARHRVSHMHIVPTMFVRLLKLPPETRRRYDLSSLRFVVHGAAPCPVAVKRAMIEWWGPVIHEYYGATETGVPVFHGPEEALRKPGTVGRVLEGASVKVIGPDGNELPPGEVGELYLRAAGMPDFTYLGRDGERREVGLGDHVTVGDVGYVDPDGYVFLCDRKRDMVISGGVNIYPAEIEGVLLGMPGVRDCAVFGIPDDEFGERLAAHVEPEPGVELAPEAIRAFLATHVAKYKVPGVIRIERALPREDSGKIFKRKLRAPYWEGAGRKI